MVIGGLGAVVVVAVLMAEAVTGFVKLNGTSICHVCTEEA